MGCCGNHTVADSSEFKVNPDDGFAGPLKERRCQDVWCLLILIAFIIGMLAVFGLALTKGDINRILNGLDSYGNVCGKKNEKVFPDIPKNGMDYTKNLYLKREDNADNFLELVCVEKCTDNEVSFFKRCIPKNVTIDGNLGVKFSSPVGRSNFFRQANSDLQYCWREIIYLCLIAFVVTIIITIMLRFLAAVIIYVAMVLMIILTIAATVYVWFRFYQAKKIEDEKKEPFYKVNSRNWLIGAIISTVLCVLFLITMWVLRKRLKLVIALFKEAGKAIAAMPFILVQPIWTFLCILVICALWFYCILWMQTYGSFVKADDGVRVDFKVDIFIKIMRWYYAFGLLWLVWFCFGCQHCVIAGAIASWFFTRDKSKLGTPIIKSTGRTIRYHLGSIAFGSLIIAIIKFIRIIVSLLQRQAKKSQNPIAACCFHCLQCCLSCIENCIKYITRNAYIEIAIYGYNFCKAARKAFHIITNNSLRITAINSVGDFALFISKMLVVVAVAFIGMELIRAKQGVTHVWLPVLIACLFAYFIADCFLSVYEMTIDTLFVCFCEDCERNDGINRPYFMSASLMKFVEDGKKTMEYM